MTSFGKDFKLNGSSARSDHSYFCCGSKREINDTPFLERTTVVNSHDDLPPILQVSNPHHSVEGQGPMGRSIIVHIEHLSICGFPAIEFVSIIRGDSGERP